uniref:Phosphatidylserine synthase putative n=1 Tax=Albugo laibachii Nc14 TaxID=890382 RepID=F0WIJ3_9STRA|nr:phosphatidylserine synthase putative [Albugo laibachii Nc14]|eukprot:CCA21075.1 phosphatidylserine synthase putative [Albugo laibachii Nc14]
MQRRVVVSILGVNHPIFLPMPKTRRQIAEQRQSTTLDTSDAKESTNSSSYHGIDYQNRKWSIDEKVVIQDDEDDSEWITKPHTLLYGSIFFVWIIYQAFSAENEQRDSSSYDIDTFVVDLKRGISFACAFFLMYCMLQLPDGHFVRPHPIVWRLITGIFLLYELFLLIILFLQSSAARQILKHFDPSLGAQLPESSFASDCRLFTPENPESMFYNVKSTFFDRFVVMHFVGWFVGALMIRSHIICWTLSILFELYELTFRHWLPNFNECWWDHLVFDILLCNALGIYVGMRLGRQLEMKKYNWVGIRRIPNLTGKAKRALAQFTPAYWLAYDWKIFRSADRFSRVLCMVFMLSVMMINSFFLKAVLWIPTSSYLNVVRLCIWYSAGSYAIAEYYVFTTMTLSYPGERYVHVNKLGPRAWLGVAVVTTEVCVIIKHGRGMFTEPFPIVVKAGWSIASVVLLSGSLLYFQMLGKQKSNDIK